MSFFPSLTRQKYGRPETAAAPRRRPTRVDGIIFTVADAANAAAAAAQTGCRLREREDGGSMVGGYYVELWGRARAGRCLHTGYVIQKEREERGDECYATMSLAVVDVVVGPSAFWFPPRGRPPPPPPRTP